MEHVDRLKLYIEHIGLPISQFADTAQIPRPTLSQILSGRNRKISNELLGKLHSAFPRLNVSWLLFGDGEMEINGIPKIVPQSTPQPEAAKPQQAPTQPPINPTNLLSGLISGAQESSQASANVSHGPSNASDADPQASVQQPNPQTFQSINNHNQATPDSHISLTPDLSKKIQNIIVFYNDSSFEIFSPAQNQ